METLPVLPPFIHSYIHTYIQADLPTTYLPTLPIPQGTPISILYPNPYFHPSTHPSIIHLPSLLDCSEDHRNAVPTGQLRLVVLLPAGPPTRPSLVPIRLGAVSCPIYIGSSSPPLLLISNLFCSSVPVPATYPTDLPAYLPPCVLPYAPTSPVRPLGNLTSPPPTLSAP